MATTINTYANVSEANKKMSKMKESHDVVSGTAYVMCLLEYLNNEIT